MFSSSAAIDVSTHNPVLVTGGTGFVAGHIISQLLSKGKSFTLSCFLFRMCPTNSILMSFVGVFDVFCFSGRTTLRGVGRDNKKKNHQKIK
jgi:hypothetical protein